MEEILCIECGVCLVEIDGDICDFCKAEIEEIEDYEE